MQNKRLAVASAVVAFTSLNFTDAHATRTFVSGQGSDSGICSPTAPCRSFAYAITQAGTGGEIVVLSSAGYGPLTINQSITITNPSGVEAGITAVTGGNAVTINAPAGSAVTLHGLTLMGNGNGANGIAVTSFLGSTAKSTVNIIDCQIKDFTQDGISIAPSASSTPTLDVVVKNTDLLNNNIGLDVQGSTNVSVRVAAYHVVADDNAIGINVAANQVGGLTEVLLTDGHIDGNSSAGALVSTSAVLAMKMSTATANGVNSLKDVESQGTLELLNNNSLSYLYVAGGTAFTDGSNNVGAIEQGALTRTSQE